MIDYELELHDRLMAIRSVNQKYDLLNNAYLSFSGGKDSTVLHYLLDIALPNNKIPRVYIDTGIELLKIREFVFNLSKNDDRFVIIKPSVPIKPMLEQYGYPFKSKEHSLRVYQFNKGVNSNFIKKYMWLTEYRGKYLCPKSLLYQFKERGKYNYSNLCCYKLKKEPAKRYEKFSGRHIVITGMRNAEGGNRERLGCVITDSKNGNLLKFHPLVKVDEDFENSFIESNHLSICELYYAPYNCKRTGCVGCPFNLHLQEDLDMLAQYLPMERRRAEIIWKPVYDEYRRLGYRLNSQPNLFDYIY